MSLYNSHVCICIICQDIQIHMYNIQLFNLYTYTFTSLPLASLARLSPPSPNLARLSPPSPTLACPIFKCICIIYNYIHVQFTSLSHSAISHSPLSSLSWYRSPLSSLSQSRSLSQSLLSYIQIHMYNIQLSNHYTYTIHLSPALFPLSLASLLHMTCSYKL